MGDSLQDQLRALGLASSQPSRGSKKNRPGRKNEKRAGDGKETRTRGELSLDQAYALRQREERRQAQRARQQKQEEVRRRRKVNKAIQEIVAPRRQNSDDANIPRNFLFNGRIRKIYVTAEQQQALSGGQLGIVYLSGSYHLLDTEALAAVRQISKDHIVDLARDSSADDPEYPVPDDLVW